MRFAVACLCVLLVGGGEPALSTTISLIADEPYRTPTLFLELPYTTDRSTIGHGSFELSAEPETDEIRVHVLVGVPARTRKWDSCLRIELDLDGDRASRDAHWAGVPMRRGVFDALVSEITIEDVRRIGSSREVRVHLCGDELLLDAAALDRIRRFEEQFDELGQYDGPSAPTPPPEPGPSPAEENPRRAPPEPGSRA